MNYQEIRARVVARLGAHGWTVLCAPSPALASRNYKTAAAEKEAHVYMSWNADAEEPNFRIMGEYRSEGRNVLEGDYALVRKTVSSEELDTIVDKFVARNDVTVNQSYARKIWLGRGNQPEVLQAA